MKKTILILSAVSLVFATADAQLFKSKKKTVTTAPVVRTKVLNNDVDSMSYSLGMNAGYDFKSNLRRIPGKKSNLDLIIMGFANKLKGDSTLLEATTAAEYFDSYISKALIRDSEENKVAGEKFLEENKTKDSVITTASGLQYKVLVAGKGSKPTITDSVEVHYSGYLINGSKFDSSVDRGRPVLFPLKNVIQGWIEGLQLMPVGSKYKFFLPYSLGYKDQGNGNSIPAYSTLIFDVELLAVKPLKVFEPIVETKAIEPQKAKNATGKSAKKK